MTPQFHQKAQQAENRWLSPLLPSILAAVSLIVTVDPASLAAVAIVDKPYEPAMLLSVLRTATQTGSTEQAPSPRLR